MRTLLLLALAFPALPQNVATPVYTGTVVPPTCIDNTIFFKLTPPPGGGLFFCSNGLFVPTAFVAPGQITLILSGVCPFGFSEITALDGKTIIGTIAAHGNVGTTGGSDTITPAGTVSAPVFTGSSGQVTSSTSGGTPAGTVAAPVFTGAPLSTHTHELPYQINSSTQTRQISAAVFGTGTARTATGQAPAGAANTASAAVALTQGVSAGTPAGTNSAPAFTGSALAGHTHTLTPAGTNSAPTFSGNSVDNRSAFIRVIFCVKD